MQLKTAKPQVYQLYAEREKELMKMADKKTIEKLTIFGLIELGPALIGVILHFTVEPMLTKYDYFIIGIVFTIVLTFIFRKRIPEIPFQIKDGVRG